MSGEGDSRFDRPRIYAAGFCFALLGVLGILDAVSPEYALSEITLSLLLASGLALLGLEVSDMLRRG